MKLLMRIKVGFEYMYRIECDDCGHVFDTPTRRWVAQCPRCGRRESLGKMQLTEPPRARR